MTTKLIKIGNSKGVRLTKEIIGELELGQELYIRKEQDSIIVTPSKTSRKNWVKQMKKEQSDKVSDDWAYLENDFDKKEWIWEGLEDLM